MDQIPGVDADFDELPLSVAYSDNERTAADALITAHYDQLAQMARARRHRSRTADTLQTGDIVHEALIRMRSMSGFNSEDHFLKVASLAMRQVIIDHARRNLSQKRRAEGGTVSADAVPDLLELGYSETPEQLVMISDLLSAMASENPTWVPVVDARYFSGLTETETATMLGVSERTVRRHWSAAREWLATNLDLSPGQR